MTSGRFWAHGAVQAIIITLSCVFGTACVGSEASDAEESATSEAPLTHVLAAPSGFAVAAVTATEVDLKWVDPNKDETGYQIERSAASGGTFALIAQTSKDASSYQDKSVIAGASYLYRARALKKGGVSTYSNVVAATIPGGAPTVTPTNLAFGNQRVGTTSAPRAVTIANNDASHSLSVSIPLMLGDFSIPGNSMSCSSYAVSTLCTLAPGASGTVNVAFTPSTAGVHSGTLALGVGSATVNVALSGNGVLQGSLSATSLAFGNQYVGVTSASRSLTVTNTDATSPLSVSYDHLFGDFSVIGSSMSCSLYGAVTNICTLAPGASGTIDLVLTPSVLGARTGSLPVGIGNATVDIALSGNGVLQGNVSATSIAFGDQLAGVTSATRSITVTNTDAASLLKVSYDHLFGDFSVIGSSMSCSLYGAVTNICYLAPGASGTIDVVLTPSALGARAGALPIGIGNGTLNVALTGNGVIPAALSSTSVVFGNQPVGTTSAPKALFISNTSAVNPVTISYDHLFGEFSVIGTTMSCSLYGAITNICTLDPGQSGTITIVVTPSALGARTGTLPLGIGGGTVNIALSGNGT